MIAGRLADFLQRFESRLKLERKKMASDPNDANQAISRPPRPQFIDRRLKVIQILAIIVLIVEKLLAVGEGPEKRKYLRAFRESPDDVRKRVKRM